MPSGDNSSDTDQQRRAGHIEQGYEERGVAKPEAQARAWATVDTQDGGGRSAAGRCGAGRHDAGRHGA